MNPIELVAAATALIAIIVSLITAYSSARRSAYDELKGVVADLKIELAEERAERKKLENDLDIERRKRIRIEGWAYALARQLQDNNVQPVQLETS